jgi:hypothetical protein
LNNVQDPVKRPSVVTVMAWVWVAAAALLLFSALGSLLVNLITSSSLLFEGFADMQEIWPEGSIQALMMKYYGLVALIQMLACILIVLSSVRLLKGKSWARLSLEVFSWLGILYNLFGGYIGLENLQYMDSYSPELADLQDHGFTFIEPLMIGITVVSTIAFITPFIISVVVMRRASVKDYCVQRGF